jgi:hypothetical protein
MKKFLLIGTAIVFAGIAATAAVAADHKSTKHSPTPTRATVVLPTVARTAPAHKGPAPKRHTVVKKHHAPVHRHHAK